MKAGSYRENQLASERAKLSAHSGADVVIAIRAPRALGTSDAQPEFDRWLNADEEDIDNSNGKNTTRLALLTSKNPRSRHSRQNIHKDTKTHEEVQLRRRSGSFRRLSSEQVLQKACFISKFYASVLLSSMCDRFDWGKYLFEPTLVSWLSLIPRSCKHYFLADLCSTHCGFMLAALGRRAALERSASAGGLYPSGPQLQAPSPLKAARRGTGCD